MVELGYQFENVKKRGSAFKEKKKRRERTKITIGAREEFNGDNGAKESRLGELNLFVLFSLSK